MTSTVAQQMTDKNKPNKRFEFDVVRHCSSGRVSCQRGELSVWTNTDYELLGYSNECITITRGYGRVLSFVVVRHRTYGYIACNHGELFEGVRPWLRKTGLQHPVHLISGDRKQFMLDPGSYLFSLYGVPGNVSFLKLSTPHGLIFI